MQKIRFWTFWVLDILGIGRFGSFSPCGYFGSWTFCIFGHFGSFPTCGHFGSWMFWVYTLAALAAADVVAQKMVSAERIRLVTFGQPRVGDAKWAAQMKKELAHYTYRIVHDNDVVPHVPPLFFKGYQHHNTEVFYATEGMMGSPEFCANSPEENGENEGCSEKQTNLSVSEHLHYFGYNVNGFGKSGCVEENGNEAQKNPAQKHKASVADVYQEMHNGNH